MLNVGDIVRIKRIPDAMEGSPAHNLEGSIVEITEVKPYGTYLGYPVYHFKFIEKVVKNQAKCDDGDCERAWEEGHFEPYFINPINVDETSLLEIMGV